MKFTNAAALSLSVAIASVAMSGGPASAAPSKPGETREIAARDGLCEQARAISRQQGPCSVRETTATSEQQGVSVNDLTQAEADLRSADGTRLGDAASTRTIWTRTWSQERRGLYYINWLEKHTGRIYYDGSRVWSTTSTSGFKGSHTCNQGFGIGYSVKVTKCSTEKISSGSLREWDYFQVHVVAQGIPLYVSHSMSARMTGKGAIS